MLLFILSRPPLIAVTGLAASNSRLGYSIPITVVVTNREETTFYTYNRKKYHNSSKRISYTLLASEKKFYWRTHLKIEYFQRECDLDKDPEDVQELQLQRMTDIRASEPFSKLLTSFNDSHSGTGAVLFDSGRIPRFHPGNDTPFSPALSFATSEYSKTIIFTVIHLCNSTLWRQNDSTSAMNTVSCDVFAQPCNQLELLLSVSFT